MPFLELEMSPHAQGVSPVPIHYRDAGRGRSLVFLHGGWGYEAYRISAQIEALQDQVRFVIPDRSGHGRSAKFSGQLPTDFHRRAAEETLLVLDALRIERTVFWGHSDGAVIAALIGLMAPERCERLVLEAFHFYRNKPSSIANFFRRFANHPEAVSEKLQRLLVADHGAEHWKNVVQRNCRVWLQLAEQSTRPDEDLYGARLGELRVPVTFIHGQHDPRTEPGEMDRVRAALVGADVRFLESGRHSPHSEQASAIECTEILRALLTKE